MSCIDTVHDSANLIDYGEIVELDSLLTNVVAHLLEDDRVFEHVLEHFEQRQWRAVVFC
jgi:hypothetical protein